MDLKPSLMRDYESTHKTPGWVKMTGRIVIFVLLLFGSLHLIGRSLIDHASVGHGNHAPLSSATEQGRQQP
jgi:hypothetical protein